MRALMNVTVLIAAGGVLLVSSGCGKTTGRTVDVKAGEYYSEQEYTLLSNSQKSAYCSALQDERDRLQTELESNQGNIKATRAQIEATRGQITPTEKEILRLDAEIRTLTSQVTALEALPREWTVTEGECLSIISNRDEIYADAYKWPRIYRANLDKIEDPVWIYPGMKLAIPRELPTEYKVAPYETLETIAGYWEIYGDPAQWTRLYEANKDKVKDPYDLVPGTMIVIPR